MAMEVRFLERLRKKARNGVRDWPMATIDAQRLRISGVSLVNRPSPD
jgi:hypothetical protein